MMTAPDSQGGDIPIAESVQAILRQLEAAGYETWCVGGAIRDELLGNVQRDVDLATAATPDVVQRLFKRTVPVGIAHGTVGVLDERNALHEVTTFRKDVRTDGRHAIVEFGVSLDDDLARRDFTINAIAYHPVRREWRDPFGGRDDLARGVVRAVGDPAARFSEDRLRILRAIRFAARFEFTIDRATWSAALAQSGDTRHLSAERVREEWSKGIATTRSVPRLAELWAESGVSRVWLPEYAPSPWHVRIESREAVLVTAALCVPGGPVWRRFKGSVAEIKRAEAIDRGPATPASSAPRDVRRWMATVADAARDLEVLAIWRDPASAGWTEVAEAVRRRGDATSRGALAVRGEDLAAAGVAPGPAMGEVLEQLLNAVLEDPALNTREALLALVRDRA